MGKEQQRAAEDDASKFSEPQLILTNKQLFDAFQFLD